MKIEIYKCMNSENCYQLLMRVFCFVVLILLSPNNFKLSGFYIPLGVFSLTAPLLFDVETVGD